jgi:hypothetical protein
VIVSADVKSALARGDAFAPDAEQRDRFLEERKTDVGFKWNVAVREAVLTAGAGVAVAGVARWETASDGTSSYRDNARILTLRGSKAVPIFLCDDANVWIRYGAV